VTSVGTPPIVALAWPRLTVVGDAPGGVATDTVGAAAGALTVGAVTGVDGSGVVAGDDDPPPDGFAVHVEYSTVS